MMMPSLQKGSTCTFDWMFLLFRISCECQIPLSVHTRARLIYKHTHIHTYIYIHIRTHVCYIAHCTRTHAHAHARARARARARNTAPTCMRFPIFSSSPQQPWQTHTHKTFSYVSGPVYIYSLCNVDNKLTVP
jgi:hypothetical protein